MSLWAPPTMSFKNRVPLKSIYEWGVNSKVTKQSNHYVKDTSERVVRRCDDTVDKKRVNSCALKHLFLERVEQPKILPKKPGNAKILSKKPGNAQWRKQLLRIFGPELIQINEIFNSLIKIVRSTDFKKPGGVRSIFLRHSRNFENVTLVARRNKHFREFWAIFWLLNSHRREFFLVNNNSLTSCQQCRHSIEPRALTCPFKQSNSSAWSLLSWHPTHTYLWRRLYFILIVCSPPSQSRRVTQIMSAEALLFNGFG